MGDRRRYIYDDLGPLSANDHAELAATVVRMAPRDVAASRPTSEHPAREAAAEDLDERTYLLGCRRRGLTALEPIEKVPVSAGHRRHVLRLFLAPLDLEATNARTGEFGELRVGAEILRGNQVAAVELCSRRRVGEHVILAARLRA